MPYYSIIIGVKVMKVAIYVRVSTLEQSEHGYSIDEQTDILKSYAEIKDWSVYKTYVDGGHSGAKLDRPALTKLLIDAKQHKFDAVLVYKLDRLSRSQKDTLYIIEDILIKNNIEFISLQENLDTASPFGKAMLGILAVFAQLEREQITERMRMGRIGRAKAGKAMSWGFDPYGYSYINDTYEIVPIETEIIRSMFLFYIQKGSVTALVKKLNDDGYIGKDIPWTYRTVKQVLENPVYIGKNQYLNQVFDGNHKAIISEETFIKAKELMEKARRESNNPRPFEAKYLLSGLIRCARCDSPMMTVMNRPRKDGTRRILYRCKSYKKTTGSDKNYHHINCDSESLAMDELEFQVLSQIEKIRRNPSKALENGLKDFTQEINLYTDEIKKLDGQREKLLDLYVDGALDKEKYLTRMESIEAKIQVLQHKISLLSDEKEMSNQNDELIKDLTNLPSNVFQLTDTAKFNLVRKIIEEISCDVGKVNITWKFN